MKGLFITPSNAGFYDVLREDAVSSETNWTINRHARIGDRMLLYICAPVSAIVAIATVATAPQVASEINSEWFGHWLADMYDLQLLAAPVTRSDLLKQFPDWGYWKQPRNSVRVPDAYSEGLLTICRA